MMRDRILWLILALGAALRFWQIDGDLPYVFHYDEPTLVDNAVWMLQHGTLNPHFFNYPTGVIYLLAGLFGLLLFWGTVLGQFAGWKAAIAWLSTHTYPRPPEGGVLYFYPTIGVPVLYLIGRIVSASAGIGAIAILYALARRAGGSQGIARLAALMLALSPLAVEHSHLITTDMTATMLATACLLLAIKAEGGGRWERIRAERGGRSEGIKAEGCDRSERIEAQGVSRSERIEAQGIGRSERIEAQGIGRSEWIEAQGVSRSEWIKAGILGGLAAGVKYNAGLIVVVLILLAVWRWRVGAGMGRVVVDGGSSAAPPAAPSAAPSAAPPKTPPATTSRPSTPRLLLYAGAAAVAAFLLTTPFALLDAPSFLRDLGYEFRRVGSITASFRGAEVVEATPAEKLAGIFWHNLGLFGIAAALWGAVLAIRSRSYAKVAVVIWVAIEILPQLRWWSLYARYLLLAWPAILLLAAWGIEDAARRVHDSGLIKRFSRPRELATTVLVILVLAPGTTRLITREARRGRPDPRVEMTAWIEENVPQGSRVVVEPAGAFPSNARFAIDRVDFLGRSTPDEYLARGIRILAASGRERLIEGKEPYRQVEENLQRIRDGSDVPWSSGKYAIYFIRGENSWLEAVEEAVARRDFGQARSVLEELVRSGERTPYLYKQLAEAYLQTGDTTAAMAAYREVARLDTTDVAPRLALGDFALSRGDWEGSLRELRAALRIAPRAPIVFHNLAVTYLYRARDRIRAGDPEAGRADWLLARENAATCAKTAPGDSAMVQVREQVERMGRRWGFVGAR